MWLLWLVVWVIMVVVLVVGGGFSLWVWIFVLRLILSGLVNWVCLDMEKTMGTMERTMALEPRIRVVEVALH